MLPPVPPVPDAHPALASLCPQCLEATITAAYMLGTRAMHVCSGRTVTALAKKASASVQVGFRWWGKVLSRRTGPRCVCQHCCARRLHLEAAMSNLQRIFRSSMPVAWCACSRSGFGCLPPPPWPRCSSSLARITAGCARSQFPRSGHVSGPRVEGRAGRSSLGEPRTKCGGHTPAPRSLPHSPPSFLVSLSIHQCAADASSWRMALMRTCPFLPSDPLTARSPLLSAQPPTWRQQACATSP